MSRNLKPSALTYLKTTDFTRIAHLIRLELSDSVEASKVYEYFTDYQSDVLLEGNTYAAGKVLKVGEIRQTQGITNYKLSIDIAGEFEVELNRGLVENTNTSYIGKSIQVLRAYLDSAGNIIPFDLDTEGPMEYFTGDVSDINISESVTKGSSTVTWQCAGKFQDFELVNGRVTDDASHRGLAVNADGNLAPSDAAKKESHKTDKGFQHANQTINVVTNYTSSETRYKVKSSWLGFRTKTVKYEVQVENSLELGLDLSAKFLPKLYGVRKTSGIPVFLDTLVSDPRRLYVVYAFSEGEIESFLNFYINNSPIICSSESDQNNSVCLGNQANGDTLSAFSALESSSAYENLIENTFNTGKFGDRSAEYEPIILQIPPVEAGRSSTEGTRDREEFNIINQEQGVAWVQVFHGKTDQAACETLKNIAGAGNFRLQQAWLTEKYGTRTKTTAEKQEYWDQHCKLLDTSYIVMEIAITEDNSEIPEIEAVISGTLVDTYSNTDNGTTPVPGTTPPAYKSLTKTVSLNPAWQVLDYVTDSTCGGNLDVDKQELNVNSFIKVSQSLDKISTSYEDSFVNYWRYLGWKTPPGTNTVQINGANHDTQKTVMQTNVMFRTESAVTKNIKSLLSQFDGTMNILGGKYHLSTENNDAPIADIYISDVKGSVATKDLSNKNKWNSIQASIQDPTQNWGTTQINFFNSDYLEEDNGISKKGNVVFSYLTNYYTAREWAQRELSNSRYSREIRFSTYHKFLGLYPNCNVTFTYDRFGYDKKVFRVTSTTLLADGGMAVVLNDFDQAQFTEGSDDNLSEYEQPTTVPKPTGVEYVALPSTRFNTVKIPGVYGLLVWDVVPGNTVLRYKVADWLQLAGESTVPVSTIITENNGTARHFIAITGLRSYHTHPLKVRSLNQKGNTSLYTAKSLTILQLPDPSKFSNVQNFVSDNDNIDNEYIGSTISFSWDAHTDANVLAYDIEFRDTSNDLIGIKNITSGETYSYTLPINMGDYASVKGGVGAYRAVKCRIRATNNNLITSEWTDII